MSWDYRWTGPCPGSGHLRHSQVSNWTFGLDNCKRFSVCYICVLLCVTCIFCSFFCSFHHTPVCVNQCALFTNKRWNLNRIVPDYVTSLTVGLHCDSPGDTGSTGGSPPQWRGKRPPQWYLTHSNGYSNIVHMAINNILWMDIPIIFVTRHNFITACSWHRFGINLTQLTHC